LCWRGNSSPHPQGRCQPRGFVQPDETARFGHAHVAVHRGLLVRRELGHGLDEDGVEGIVLEGQGARIGNLECDAILYVGSRCPFPGLPDHACGDIQAHDPAADLLRQVTRADPHPAADVQNALIPGDMAEFDEFVRGVEAAVVLRHVQFGRKTTFSGRKPSTLYNAGYLPVHGLFLSFRIPYTSIMQRYHAPAVREDPFSLSSRKYCQLLPP
jgi:hypothetical protein